MSVVTEKRLKDRSGSVCEISGSDENLVVYLVAPKTEAIPENCILITKSLKEQIENKELMQHVERKPTCTNCILAYVG